MCTHSKTRALSLLVLIMFLFVPIAGAVSNAGNSNANLNKASKTHNTGDDFFKELSTKAELYNQNFDKVPAIIKKLVGSEEILVKIKLENGKTLSVAVTTNNGKIETFSKYDSKSNFKPSITVETDEKTVRKILDSNDPFKEVFKFMKNGSVEVDGESCYQKIALQTLEKMV